MKRIISRILVWPLVIAATWWLPIGCGGCSKPASPLMDDPFGPLTAAEEEAYLQEMEVADAHIRREDR